MSSTNPQTHSPLFFPQLMRKGWFWGLSPDGELSSIFPFQHFFQNCRVIPLSLTPAKKYSTLVLPHSRYRKKRTPAPSKVVPISATDAAKASHPRCPCITCRGVFCFMDIIQAAAVQVLTPQIWCKWMDSWDSSGQPFFYDFLFRDTWCSEDGVLLLLHKSSLWQRVRKRLFQASHKEMH